MANFELCIYVLPEENFDEVVKEYEVHDVSDLTDEDFIEVSENLGTVHTLRGLLHQKVISPEIDSIRAFFINRDNPESEPIKADGFETVITANKIADWTDNKILFEEA